MNTYWRVARRGAAFTMTALLAGTGFAGAAELMVQTVGHRSFADVGDSGGQLKASASLTVQVTRDGRPVLDLGQSILPNPDGITLPPSWLLRSIAGPVGPGLGCHFTPTAFQNRGNGEYAIKVAPSLGSPTCRWGQGDYHYTVSVRTPLDQGVGLGVLSIPATPAEPRPAAE
jgi:hypothetical protein